MANPIMCVSQDGQQAAWLISNLEDGDTLGLCGECFPEWVAAMWSAMAEPVDQPIPDVPAEPDEATDAASGPQAAQDAPAATDTPNTPQRGRRGRQGPSGDQPEPPEPNTTPVTTDTEG